MSHYYANELSTAVYSSFYHHMRFCAVVYLNLPQLVEVISFDYVSVTLVPFQGETFTKKYHIVPKIKICV